MRIGNNHTAATQEEPNAHECQPYLEQKAELEDQERRKHELEATERRYGLMETTISMNCLWERTIARRSNFEPDKS